MTNQHHNQARLILQARRERRKPGERRVAYLIDAQLQDGEALRVVPHMIEPSVPPAGVVLPQEDEEIVSTDHQLQAIVVLPVVTSQMRLVGHQVALEELQPSVSSMPFVTRQSQTDCQMASSHQRDPGGSPRRSLRELQFRPPLFHWRCVVLVALVVSVAVMFFLSSLWGRHASVRSRVGACVTDECYFVAKFLGKSLNFSVDPCLDFDSFVCSKWNPQSGFISTFEVEMNQKHMQRMANLLLTGKPHFSESTISTRFMQKCTDQTENPAYLKLLSALAKHIGIPWPYHENEADSVSVRHPLQVVVDLSVRWGVHTWFDVVLRAFESEARSGRAFYIKTGRQPHG
ncbi:hypothetical protein MRX96_056170 [Rhipicephalus microplus]